MPKFDPAKIKKVSFSLPFGIGFVEWEVDPTERKAAWSLYVELVTRIAVQPLEVDNGLLQEALTSLYNLFPVTWQVLKEGGPDVGASHDSVRGIAIAFCYPTSNCYFRTMAGKSSRTHRQNCTS